MLAFQVKIFALKLTVFKVGVYHVFRLECKIADATRGFFNYTVTLISDSGLNNTCTRSTNILTNNIPRSKGQTIINTGGQTIPAKTYLHSTSNFTSMPVRL